MRDSSMCGRDNNKIVVGNDGSMNAQSKKVSCCSIYGDPARDFCMATQFQKQYHQCQQLFPAMASYDTPGNGKKMLYTLLLQ